MATSPEFLEWYKQIEEQYLSAAVATQCTGGHNYTWTSNEPPSTAKPPPRLHCTRCGVQVT